MAKLGWNAFIQKHTKGHAVHLGYSHYKRGGIIPWSGQSAPSPLDLTNALAVQANITCDFAVRTEPKTSNTVTTILISDAAEATRVAGLLGATVIPSTLPLPYLSRKTAAIDRKSYLLTSISLQLVTQPPVATLQQIKNM